MALAGQILKFLERPFPLWETALTHQLIEHKWRELQRKGLQSFSDYSTARFWFEDSDLVPGNNKKIDESTLLVEMPSNQMQSFYDEHGLQLLTEDEIEADAALPKIKKAMSILRLIEPAYDFITRLVRSIHILRQPDVEIDLSYSHPSIPFSIFVSVCADDSEISNLRVAESILHEAMHLKLTLIENFVPLVEYHNSLYYSPWRDEERPIRGVLHGLFVFRAIHNFYLDWIPKTEEVEVKDYIKSRIENIKLEISSIKNLHVHNSLTEKGRLLTLRLSQLYPSDNQ